MSVALLPWRGGPEPPPDRLHPVDVRYMDLDTVTAIAWRKGATRRLVLAVAIKGLPEELTLRRAGLSWLRGVVDVQRMGIWLRPGPRVGASAADVRAVRVAGRPG